MAQILPAPRDPGGDIGAALGQGLGQGIQRRMQRSQLHDALEQVKQVAGQPDASAFDLASSLIESTSMIPGAERYVGQLLPFLTQQMQLKQAGRAPSAPGQPAQQPSQQMERQPAGNISRAVNEATRVLQSTQPSQQQPGGAPGSELFTSPTTTNPAIADLHPDVFTPDEIRTAVLQAQQMGQDPSLIEKQMDDHNTRVRQGVQDVERSAASQATIEAAKQAGHERFREALRARLPDKPEEDYDIMDRISRRPDIANMNEEGAKARKTVQLFQEYELARNNFQEGAARWNSNKDKYNEQVKRLRQTFGKIQDAGQSEWAMKTLAEGGWGPVEIENIVNPIDPNITNTLAKFPQGESMVKEIGVPSGHPEFEKRFEKAREKRDKWLDRAKMMMEKEIKPGVYTEDIIKRGTPLLTLRNEWMQKGMYPHEFESIVSDLVDNNKINLDTFQSSQRSLLGKDPKELLGFWEILARINPYYIPRK